LAAEEADKGQREAEERADIAEEALQASKLRDEDKDRRLKSISEDFAASVK